MIDKEKAGRVPTGQPSKDTRPPEPASGSAQSAGRPTGEPPGAAQRAPGSEVHAYISRQLRAVYDDVAKQPVPERFLDLMRQLDAKTGDR